MDKKDYIDTLKQLNLRPKKIKVTERSESVLMEQGDKEDGKLLKEIFVQSSEIENMPAGPRRDMAILRLGIIAEQDASNLYEKMISMTKNKDIQKLLLDISNEEKVHVGEFEFMLEHIDPDYEKKENEGGKEADDLTGLGEPPNEED